jgi:hypothetical protein
MHTFAWSVAVGLEERGPDAVLVSVVGWRGASAAYADGTALRTEVDTYMQQIGKTTRAAIAAVGTVFALGLTTAPVAEAQVLPWEDNGYVSINYAYEVADRAFAESVTVPIYGETATYSASHSSSGGGGFDIGGGVRVWGNLAAGVAVTSFSSASAATVSGTVPHPLFFNRPRTVGADLPGLEYKETGVHLHAVWVMPITEKIIVSVAGGPSFFSVDQGLLSSVTVGQETAPFSAVSVLPSSTQASELVVGGNVGVDVKYMFTEMLGGGVFVRWAGASVDLPTTGGVQSIDVGGVQSGVGLRIAF